MKKQDHTTRFYSVNFRNNRLFVVVVLPEIHFFIEELNRLFDCDLSRFLPDSVVRVFNGKRAIEKYALFTAIHKNGLRLFPDLWKWSNSNLLASIYDTDKKRGD